MDDTQFQEQRRAERVTVRDLRVTARDTGELVGSLVNLSFGGMLVNSATKFETKTSYKFRIPFEYKILGRDYFDFEAECVWCNNDINPAIYSVGFFFPLESGEHMVVVDQINSRYQGVN